MGQVVSVKLSDDENKKSRGYGLVQYEKKDQANTLLSESQQNEVKYHIMKRHKLLDATYTQNTFELRMRRPFQQQFPNPVRQTPLPPPAQQITNLAPIQAVALDKRQNLVELLTNLENFNTQEEQNDVVLQNQTKLNQNTKSHWKKVNEVLSDPSNLTSYEILDMIKNEDQFNELVDDAVSQLKEEVH